MSPSRRDPFVVAHRGASAEKKEHTLAAYDLALREGADGLECDVRLTRDGHIVCVHDRRVDRTSTGSGRVSELHLEALKAFDYGDEAESAELLTLSDLIELVLDWTSKPTKLFIETKHPVRYGSLIENKVLAELHRYGLAQPASADFSRAVIMSFAPTAVWRVRRFAPLLPTVLLGESSYYLGGGAASTVGATAIGPSIRSLSERPWIVDRAAASGRATYCWTVEEKADVELCRDLGVSWIATNNPGRTRAWLDTY
ncbi:glycerophosphodiester phosphodiesterase family protein [Rhodococcus sp. 1168]|uniref:glycerophosphodiester phosphodiesterase family protein n=1 Tax=Rhodococcus sp. 1168 TaxID=2018041 RepID=UPI000A0E9198|nr:glycerophosphodiester phosphodiesterase family protein [Rhodococcus sp. 1168]ORI25107.1 glycerophosphodiester phosphodiesterase [Rhodococcus sp. 1168]